MQSDKSQTAVTDRESLAEFIQELARDLSSHPERWENADLSSYLHAMAAWVQDMDGYFANKGCSVPDMPSWALLADILAAAKVYE